MRILNRCHSGIVTIIFISSCRSFTFGLWIYSLLCIARFRTLFHEFLCSDHVPYISWIEFILDGLRGATDAAEEITSGLALLGLD